ARDYDRRGRLRRAGRPAAPRQANTRRAQPDDRSRRPPARRRGAEARRGSLTIVARPCYGRAMSLPARLPTYRELLARTDAPPGTAWGIFGADDQLGTLNLLTPERAKASAAEVRTGEVFSLNWNVELPDPSPFRQLPVRHQVGAGGFGRDDWLDRFYLQGSSQ